MEKIELINWLTKQDEAMVKKIDALRISSIESAYQARMEEKLDSKLRGSEEDVINGRIHIQEAVENYFKNKSAQ